MTLPALSSDQRAILQVVAHLTRVENDWPAFKVVDVKLDRQLHVADSQAALAAIPSAYLIHPTGSWGYNEADPVRLTLRGLASCAGGQSDLDLLLSLVKWAAERERDPNLADEADLALQSSEFAERLGLSLDGDEDAVREAHSILARVHFLATSLDTFYGSSGTGDERWKWHYNAVRRRVRT
jgi:hypothetical protein